MEYEYVALTWQTHSRTMDSCFMADYDRLCDTGWEVSLDAVFEPQRVGGACIMRKPKDAPRLWTEKEIRAIHCSNERATVQRLVAKGLLRDRSSDDLLGGRMNTEETKKECCVKETCEEELSVFPIYNAYLKKMCCDSEQALRLTFLEVQRRVERALTWPNR